MLQQRALIKRVSIQEYSSAGSNLGCSISY
jgi:hypothetical protein